MRVLKPSYLLVGSKGSEAQYNYGAFELFDSTF